MISLSSSSSPLSITDNEGMQASQALFKNLHVHVLIEKVTYMYINVRSTNKQITYSLILGLLMLTTVIIFILTSPFHFISFIFNIQQSLTVSPPTTSRCGTEPQLINTLE